MSKYWLILLLILCFSYSYIDPPLIEVHNHNEKLAPTDIFHTDVLNEGEREPTYRDPKKIFYVRILTLTPSVNETISSKHHPDILWLAAERHVYKTNDTFIDYKTCKGHDYIRNWGDLELLNVTAYYSLDGLAERIGNETIFHTVNESQELARTNETFYGKKEIPYQRASDPFSELFESITSLIGDFLNLSKYEPTLEYASPYPIGVNNFTVKNLTIVEPTLEVELIGYFRINYSEKKKDLVWEDGECVWVSQEPEKNIPYEFNGSDNRTYAVQNDYMTLLLFSPNFYNFEANTTEDIPLTHSLLSNSNLYKYYSTMDNMTAAFNYLYSFNVTNDTYGTQFIVAEPANFSILIKEEPRVVNNYTGKHKVLISKEGNALRNAGQFNGMSYNHSKVYYISEFFYDVPNGDHEIGMEFYTFFGNYNQTVNASVRTRTDMSLSAYASGLDEVTVTCTLTGRDMPASGQIISFLIGNETKRAVTNGLGIATVRFKPKNSHGTVFADFPGSSEYTSISESTSYYIPMNSESGDIFGSNIGLLILLSFLFAFSAINAIQSSLALFGGGISAGGVATNMMRGAKGKGAVPPGKEDEKKKKKEDEKKGEDKKKKEIEKDSDQKRKEEEKNKRKKKENEKKCVEELAALIQTQREAENKKREADKKKMEEEYEKKKLCAMKEGFESVACSQRNVKPDSVLEGKNDNLIRIFGECLKKPLGQDQRRKLERLQEYVSRKKITEEERILFVESNGINSKKLIKFLETESKMIRRRLKDEMVIQLAGEYGSYNALKLFKNEGFETETEVYPGSAKSGRLDIVIRHNKTMTIKIKTVNDVGEIFFKSVKIKKAKILGIESKSYQKQSWTNKAVNKAEKQVANSSASGNIEKTFLFVTSDFEKLSISKRSKIAEKINNAGGEIIISEYSNEETRADARLLLNKLEKNRIVV